MESRGVYRVGKYRVDLERRRVFSNGSAIELGWRHFEALRLLVEADGRVVEKDEFFRQVWQGQIVDESNLTKCIAQLRKSLNNGGDQDYLETVPRVDYRLAVPAQPEPKGDTYPSVQPGQRRWLTWVAAMAVAILGDVVVWRVVIHRQRLAEARAAYQDGRRWRREKPPAIASAVEAFRVAIRLDPNNAGYYATLAETLTKVPSSAGLDRKLMLETAERGVALDSRCSGCNAVLGFILFSAFRDWKRADQHLARAVQLDPKDAGAHGYYAMLLATQGRLDDALHQADLGIQLDPYHSTLYVIKRAVLYFMKRYGEASATAERAVSFGQDQPTAWDWRAYSHLMAGESEAAIEPLSGSGKPWYAGDLRGLFRVGGLKAAAGAVVNSLAEAPERTFRRAHWHLALGDRSGTLDDLETAQRVRTFEVMYIAVDPMFESLRGEP
jgi:DNA-binding winged helix-turn-helix (wHTH) protein